MTTTIRETLYDIGDARQILEDWVAEQEGEWTPEIEELTNALRGREKEKVESLALFIREVEAGADAIEAHPVMVEAKRLQQRAAAMRTKLKWLKDGYLKAYVQKWGTANKSGNLEVRGVFVTVALQKNNPSVQPLTAMDEDELRTIATFAPTVVRHRESWELDKPAVLAAHAAGSLDPDVAKRVQIVRTESVRIR